MIRKKPEEKSKTLNEDEISEKVESITGAYNESDTSTFDKVEELVDLGPQVIDSQIKLLESDDIYDEWTALYVLSRVGFYEDQKTRNKIIEAVKKEFNNDNPHIRLMAASVAFICGNSEGTDILIEGLSNEDMLILTEPPMPICQYCSTTLSYYFDQGFGDPCGNDEIVKKWRDWWEKNKGFYTWDDEQKKYVI
ncbi:hypothetical protein GF362_07410 [Candidatus Dojkabacteria bacterium]|nr:hypothetical protein [Candidatus Dojkabacteria bacterium]